MPPHSALLGQLFRLTCPPNDAELLRRWVQQGDEDAFTALVARHGRMVLGVCRRVLGNSHDAEDAFQAVFLILARKGATLHHPEALPGWLHGVAVRVASNARTTAARRRSVGAYSPDSEPRDPHPDPLDALSARELLGLIDREIARLPEVYRLPLVLCDLEERTQPEAARLLGWTLGSFRGRLMRGRERLRARLVRRGIAPAVLAAASVHGSAEAAALTASVSRLAVRYASCPVSAEVPASVAALVREGICGLMLTKPNLAALVLLAASTLVAGAGLLAWPTPAALPQAEARAENPPPAIPRTKPQVRRDQTGDPLPAEALSRLGTIRFRHGGMIHSLAFTQDGKTLVSEGADGLRIWEAATGKQIRRVGDGSTMMGTIDVSPDGKFVLLGLPSWEGFVGVLEVATGRIVQRFSKRQVRSFCLAPDGKMAATIGYHTEIDLWDPATGKALGTLKGHQDEICSVTFSSDGKTLVSAGDDKTIRFWDVASRKQQYQIKTGNQVEKIALSPDDRLLASLGHVKERKQNMHWSRSEPVIRLWDTRTGKELRQLTMTAVEVWRGEREGFSNLHFSHDGKTLVTSGRDDMVRIWDAATGKELRQFAVFSNGPLIFALHPNGKVLAAAEGGSTIRLLRLDTGAVPLAFTGHRSGVHSVHFLSNGRVAVTSSRHGQLHFWDTRTGERQRIIAGKARSVMQILPDGRTFLGSADDKKLHVFELDTGKEVRVIHGWNGREYELALSPDGRVLAQVDSQYQNVQLIDSLTGKLLHTLTGFKEPFMGMSFTPDGKRFFLWLIDKTVTVWDPHTGRKRQQFDDLVKLVVPEPIFGREKSYPVYFPKLSPDGRLLAVPISTSRPRPGILVVLDSNTGKEVCRFATAADGVSQLVFSPDGKSLAWGGWHEGTIYLGEIAIGRERHRFTGHRGRIFSLAFSVDGTTLISGSEDTTALVWDLTGRLTMGKKYGAALSTEELKTHWKTLAAEDAADGYRAVQMLAADPTRSVPYLRTRLHLIAPADEKRLQQWIADLDSDQFAIREKATKELEKLGVAALHAMREALADKPALETRRRLEQLIDKQERDERPTSGENLRICRALEVLERAQTPEAKDVLTMLAKGAPGARQTLEAKAALERMAK